MVTSGAGPGAGPGRGQGSQRSSVESEAAGEFRNCSVETAQHSGREPGLILYDCRDKYTFITFVKAT